MPPPEPRSSTLALVQLGDGGRVAAPERGEPGGVRQLAALGPRVEAGAESLGVGLRLGRGTASRPAAAAGPGLLGGGPGRLRVAPAHGLLHRVGPRGFGLLAGRAAAASSLAPQHSLLASGSQQVSWASGSQHPLGSALFGSPSAQP